MFLFAVSGRFIVGIFSFRATEFCISKVTLNFIVLGVVFVDFALVALPIFADVRSIRPTLSVF